MSTMSQVRGFTFKVDDVQPAIEPLSECRAHDAVNALIGSAIESCSDYHGTVLANVGYHPLLAAVYTAYSGHRPLVLGPDAVWITIAQGVAHHMLVHAERLRDRFVRHQGRKALEVEIHHFIKGSPENPWPEAFAGWSDQIREHVGADMHDALVCDFSTTGPAERAASQIVLMDIFERYFHYRAYCICGIPEVTLEGHVADWERLRAKLDALERFDLGWWLDHLRSICDEFVEAARGRPNIQHWRNICKLREEYGGDVINGWVAKLFPYLREYIDGPVRRKSPIFETGEGFTSLVAPSGLSQVPFVWRVEPPGMPTQRYDMEAIGGLLGVEQDKRTLALRPRAGWAIREAPGLNVQFERLRREHVVFPGTRTMYRQVERGTSNDRVVFPLETGLPAELGEFYFHANGARLFASGLDARYRIRRQEELVQVWGREGWDKPDNEIIVLSDGWLRFCDLDDGTFLAIDQARRTGIRKEARERWAALDRELTPKRQAERQRIRDEVARWSASRRTPPTEQEIADRFRQRIFGSKVLKELDERLEPLRRESSYDFWAIIWCRPGMVGAPGKCPIVAESITEFLRLALASEGKYWWMEQDYVGYGDAVTQPREQWS